MLIINWLRKNWAGGSFAVASGKRLNWVDQTVSGLFFGHPTAANAPSLDWSLALTR
jgi:hypothetical protein